MQVESRDFLQSVLAGHRSEGPHPWLSGLRANALERANALRLPTTQDEDWRFTDVSAIYGTTFRPVESMAQLDPSQLAPYAVAEAENRLVFVDGVYARELSRLTDDGQLSVLPMSAAFARYESVLQAHLCRLADFREDAFCAANTAWLKEGAVILLHAGRTIPAPIHVLFVSATANAVSYPRLLLVAERESAGTLIEEFVSLHQTAALTNGVSEVYLDQAARVAHVRLQREGVDAFHIGRCAVEVKRDADYRSVSLNLGARISRYDPKVVLTGEGAQCQIDGLALISGRQLADTHSVIEHAVPRGRSRQLHKCVVGGAAHAVFNGAILVRPGAQQTDSAQQSRNLLLSARAHVDTKPQLEIFADDVKCAHGAAVGQLDAEELFYLRSRGLDEAGARNLLTFAFAAELVERIPVPSLVAEIERTVLRQTQT